MVTGEVAVRFLFQSGLLGGAHGGSLVEGGAGICRGAAPFLPHWAAGQVGLGWPGLALFLSLGGSCAGAWR
eukprot:9721585-Alexandrium_andersonii.AAC.1